MQGGAQILELQCSPIHSQVWDFWFHRQRPGSTAGLPNICWSCQLIRNAWKGVKSVSYESTIYMKVSCKICIKSPARGWHFKCCNPQIVNLGVLQYQESIVSVDWYCSGRGLVPPWAKPDWAETKTWDLPRRKSWRGAGCCGSIMGGASFKTRSDKVLVSRWIRELEKSVVVGSLVSHRRF